MDKKLYRSEKDKMISGVFGGLAEYTGTDSTILRLVGILLFVFTGFVPMIIAYILAAAVMPKAETTKSA